VLCFVSPASFGVCWIEKVTYKFEPISAKGQIFIYFIKSQQTVSASVSPKIALQRYWITDGLVRSMPSAYAKPDALLVHDGDTVFLTQSVHDLCTVIVAATNERHGLEVEASSTPHNLPHRQFSTFIPARVENSQ
jgi:hypothetical protein